MRKLLSAAVVLGSLLAAPSALATDGDLDSSFSTDGKFTFEGVSNFSIEDIAAFGDGRLAAVGSFNGGANVAVIKANGTLDTSFSGDGLATVTAFPPTQIAVSGGAVVLAGEAPTAGTQLAVTRLDASGAPDGTFASGGVTQVSNRFLDDLAVDSAGRIVAIGSNGTLGDFQLTRLTVAGLVDSAFSGDGRLDVNASPIGATETQFESAEAVAIQTDDRIVVAGGVDVSPVFRDPIGDNNERDDTLEASFVAVRVTAAGLLDTTFGAGTGRSYPNIVTGGSACTTAGTARCPTEIESANAVGIEPDGQIAISGYTDANPATDINGGGFEENREIDFGVAHLNGNGSSDTAFSGDGRVSTAVAPSVGSGSSDDRAVGVAAGPGGTVVASGRTTTQATGGDFALLRYLPNGSLDTGFDGASAGNGEIIVTVKSPSSASEDARSAALMPNGNVALAGTGFGSSTYGALAMVKNDGVAPNTQIDAGPSEGSTVTTTSPSFSFSAVGEPSITTFECKYENAVHPSFIDCASPYVKALADGAHTFTVRARDAAGNVDPTPVTRNFTVDADPPNTLKTGDPGAYTADTTPTFTFTATVAATFECAVADGHELVDVDDSEFSSCGSPFTPTLTDGEYTFAVRGANSGGTDPTPAQFEFELDTDAPDGVIVTGPSGLINDRTPTFEVSTDEPFDIAEGEFDMSCNLSGALTTSLPCTDAPFEFAQSLPDGSYTLTLEVQDLLSRQDSTPATRQFQVDATRPDTLITQGPPAVIKSRRKTRRVSFQFNSTEAGSKLECRLDGAAFAPCSSPLALVVKRGLHTLEVRSTDAAGNVDASPAKRSFRLKRKPRRKRRR